MRVVGILVAAAVGSVVFDLLGGDAAYVARSLVRVLF